MRRVKSELRIRGDRHTLDWLERFSEVELEQRCVVVRGVALLRHVSKYSFPSPLLDYSRFQKHSRETEVATRAAYLILQSISYSTLLSD